ncbi:hypothetical protein C8Q75DRAFT_390853 [Abortiporus biennis]|nr:hypothetical protein C8Q75DRAFT_390853 [Abortiporus biennis]
MAMTIPMSVSSPSSAPNTPPASSDAGAPQSPISPSNGPQTLALPPPVENSSANGGNANGSNGGNGGPTQTKRKPSRRANTAERRATHNAVERQRRETLNGRFLDLAALLPNLSQIRRPSKSSIVNSSIAHIHASRRHRLLAARELRLLKVETDLLRRELNEWRDRSGLPRVEEPVRGEAFQMILSGEVEVVSAGPIEEEDGQGEYGDNDYGDEEFSTGPLTSAAEPSPQEDIRNMNLLKNGVVPVPGQADMTPFAHNAPGPQTNAGPNGGLHLQTILPRGSVGVAGGAPSPMIVQSPTAVSFENPAMASMYEPHPQSYHHPSFYPGAPNAGFGTVNDKVGSWNGVYQGAAAQIQQFTPPTSSHGSPQQGHYGNVQRPPQSHTPPQQMGHMFGSPVDGDDASSVGSAPNGNGRRERSGSMNSVGSNGYGGAPSPVSNGAQQGNNYDMMGMVGGNGQGVPRRMGSGGMWDVNMGMNGMMGMPGIGAMGGMGVGGMKGPVNGGGQAISVGGGGNGHGFAAMMM